MDKIGVVSPKTDSNEKSKIESNGKLENEQTPTIEQGPISTEQSRRTYDQVGHESNINGEIQPYGQNKAHFEYEPSYTQDVDYPKYRRRRFFQNQNNDYPIYGRKRFIQGHNLEYPRYRRMNSPNPGVWRGHHFEGNHFGQNYPSYGMEGYDQAYRNHDGKKISGYKYDNNRRFGIVRFRNGYRHFKRDQEDSDYGLRLPYYNDDTDSRDFDQISFRNQFRSKPISVDSGLDHLKHGDKDSKDAPSYEDIKYNGSDNPVFKLNTEDQRSNVRVPFIAHMEDGRNLVENRFNRPQNKGHGYNHSKKIQNSFKDVDYNSGSNSHKHLGRNPTTLTFDKVRQHNIETYKNIKGNYYDDKDVRIQRNKKNQEHLHGKNGHSNKEERKPSVEKLEKLSKPDKHKQGHGREKNGHEHYENHREGDNHKTNIKRHEFDEDSTAVINESQEFGEGYKRKTKREREERERPEKDKSNSGKYDRIINKKYKYPSKDNHRPRSKVSELSEKDTKEFHDTISQSFREKMIKKGQIRENTPRGKAPELYNWDRTPNAGGNRNPLKLGRQRYKGAVHHISKKFRGQDKQSIAIHSKENRQYHTNGKEKTISRGGKDIFKSLDQNLKAHHVYVPSPNSSKDKYHLLGTGNAPVRAHEDSDSDSDGGTGVESTRMPEEPDSNNQHQSIDGVKNLVNLSPFSLTRQLKCIKDEKATIKLEVIGRTVEYRDIVLMKMSEKIIYDSKKVFRQSNMNKYDDEAVDKKIIFIVHGLTVMGWHSLPCLSQVKSFRKLLSYYTKHLELFDIYVLPMANPDGVAKNHPLWYKNVSPQNACPGVALDRNFDVAWNLSKIYTSSCSQQFPGVVPFSERETQAIREVFHHYGHKIVGYFHVHAGQSDTDIFKGDAVLYPKGYTDSQSDDDKYIDLRGEIEEMMKNASFKVLSVTVDTIYSWYGQVAGTSVDYASTVYGIPYCLELVMQLYQDDMLVKEAEKREQHSALTEIWQSLLDVIFDSIYKNVVKTDQKR